IARPRAYSLFPYTTLFRSWAPNCSEWVVLQYATARVGLILVNLNPAYRAHEFSYAVNQSEITLVVAAPSYKKSDYRAIIASVRRSEEHTSELQSRFDLV